MVNIYLTHKWTWGLDLDQSLQARIIPRIEIWALSRGRIWDKSLWHSCSLLWHRQDSHSTRCYWKRQSVCIKTLRADFLHQHLGQLRYPNLKEMNIVIWYPRTYELGNLQLPVECMLILQKVHRSTTRACYATKWKRLVHFCISKPTQPMQSSVKILSATCHKSQGCNTQ